MALRFSFCCSLEQDPEPKWYNVFPECLNATLQTPTVQMQAHCGGIITE